MLQGPPGSELGTAGAFVPDRGDDWRLWNLAPLLPPGSATRRYRRRGELIDHILMSRALLAPDLDVRTVDSAALPSIGDLPTLRRGAPGSDHALLVATL